ncbi:MAG: hypothetical protein LBL57_07775 [Tannerella sp.]|jgi:hypothetical protein|nr:hypothetical protein [Tannerella sp.]
MVEVRFPDNGLSSDFGDIILSEVSEKATAVFSIGGNPVLEEIYYPDANGKISIRDAGQLAKIYFETPGMGADSGADGSSVTFSISLQDRSNTISKTVTIYRCDAETAGTLSAAQLKAMPLSQATKKTTGFGRTEYTGFYGSGTVSVYAVFREINGPLARTFTLHELPNSPETFYRINVSPSRIAEVAGIPEADIVYYNVYKSTSEIIRFTIDRRPYPDKTTFVFRNCFGAQETFTCTGDTETERKWERTFASVDRRQHPVSHELTRKHTVNTGYISKEMTGVLEDLMNSEDVCIITPDGWEPVVILEESFKVSSRRDALTAVEFKYRHRSNNQMQYRHRPFRKPGIFDGTYNKSFN